MKKDYIYGIVFFAFIGPEKEVVTILSLDELVILKGDHWTVFLYTKHPNCLGRMYIWANREELTDLMDITEAEGAELLAIGKKLKKALVKLFAPVRFNYTALGNVTKHLHLHLIPRYNEMKVFDRIAFIDEELVRPGTVPDATLLKLRDAIRNALSA